MRRQHVPEITRREFARTVGLAAAATSLAPGASAASPRRTPACAHVVRVAQADRRRRAQRRVRRGRPGRRSAGRPAARLALRHPQLRRRGTAAGRAGIPGARARTCAATAPRGSCPADTVRNGQQAALATDVIAFMDALKIDRAILGGFDWGARTADIVAALWPRAGQGAGVGERLPDRQSRCQSTTVGPAGRTRLVVPVLLRHRARCRRLPPEHPRLQQADLAGTPRRRGSSTTPPTTAPRRRSTTPTTSTSSSTTTAGG